MRIELRKFSLVIGFFILYCACFHVSIFSEIITLESGQTVEGEIIEETDKYVKIDFMGAPLTYSKEDIKSINKRKGEVVKIKIKPDQTSTSEFLAKIEFLEKDIGKTVTGGYGAAMQFQDGKSSCDYRETIQRTAAGIRSKINEVKRLHVAPDCERLKQLFVELYDAEADQLVRTIDNQDKEESERSRKVFNKKKERYLKEKQEVQNRKF